MCRVHPWTLFSFFFLDASLWELLFNSGLPEIPFYEIYNLGQLVVCITPRNLQPERADYPSRDIPDPIWGFFVDCWKPAEQRPTVNQILQVVGFERQRRKGWIPEVEPLADERDMDYPAAFKLVGHGRGNSLHLNILRRTSSMRRRTWSPRQRLEFDVTCVQLIPWFIMVTCSPSSTNMQLAACIEFTRRSIRGPPHYEASMVLAEWSKNSHGAIKQRELSRAKSEVVG